MSDVTEALLRILLVVIAFLVLPMVIGQTEHKVMAHMQGRIGPMYAGGFHGWGQLLADGVKFAQKEDVLPARADRVLYRLAPGVSLVPYLVALAFIPLAPRWVGAEVDAGLLVVLAVVGVAVLGAVMAGCASANKYSLLGGLRNAAQLLAYQVPFVVAAASVAMAAGSLSLTRIVEQWEPWWLAWQAIGAVVFFVAGLAQLRRPPFDMPVADTEIVLGALTEYTGLRFAFFVLAEYAGILVLCALTTVLFLGGWHGPGPDELGPLWTLLKIFLLVVVVIWVRVTFPRLSADRLQRLAWQALVPLALLQLAVTGVVAVQV